MSVLLTGGLGFVGSNLLRSWFDERRLDDFFQMRVSAVIVVDRISYSSLRPSVSDTRYRFIRADVNDWAIMQDIFRQGVDVVLHLAAEAHVEHSFQRPLDFTRANVLGTHALLELARKFGVRRFLHMSTDEIYGARPASDPADECAPCAPSTPYACSKLAADALALSYMRCFHVPVTVVRSSNIFGEFQYPDKVIPKFLAQALSDQPCTVHGTGRQRRRYLYVSDLADALALLLRQECGAYNVSADVEKSTLELADDVWRAIGKSPPRVAFVADRLVNDECYSIDDRKIRSLGWRPRVAWDEGLRRTARWVASELGKSFSCFVEPCAFARDARAPVADAL